MIGDQGHKLVYILCRYMAHSSQLSKWGNSLALRVPKAVIEEARLKEGDLLILDVASNGNIVMRASRPKYELRRLVAGITPKNRHGEIDWGKATDRELW